MSIREVRWYPYTIPFWRPFRTGKAVRTRREGAIVEIATSEGITGLGEIAPLPEFGHGNLADALAPLPEIARRFVGQCIESRDDLQACLGILPSVPAPTRCGIDMALHDACAQLGGVPLAALLTDGTPKPRVDVNAVVGAESIDATIAAARAAVRDGYGCLKLKVDLLRVGGRDQNGAERVLQQEVARIQAARDVVGPGVVLRLDANGSLTLPIAQQLLDRCAPADIEYIEQPLPAHEVRGLHQLRQHSPIAIALDESVTGAADVRDLLDQQAADVLVLKLQSMGGLVACRELIALASQYGVRCVVTTSLEAGVGVAAALHLASASEQLGRYAGLATLPLLMDDLLRQPLSVDRGSIGVPLLPGLGVALDRGMWGMDDVRRL